MISGDTVCFSFSKKFLIASPVYGKKQSLKCSMVRSFFLAFAKNFSALATASASLSPLDPRTTQWASTSSYSDKSRKIVPPQPISMSSLCAPRHKSLMRSEEHTSELQSRLHLVCRLLLEKKKNISSSPTE